MTIVREGSPLPCVAATLALTLALPVVGRAQPAAPASAPEIGDALGRYRATAVDIRPEFGALGGFRLTQGGAPIEVGFFGGDAEAVFGASPAAMEAMAAYRTRRVLGTTLWAAGLTVLLGTLVLTLTESELIYEKSASGLLVEPSGAFYALLGGGGALGDSIAEFGVRYADQTEHDWRAVLDAALAGELPYVPDERE